MLLTQQNGATLSRYWVMLVFPAGPPFTVLFWGRCSRGGCQIQSYFGENMTGGEFFFVGQDLQDRQDSFCLS